MQRALRISIVGCGPAGLYLAILMKRLNPGHQVTILERDGPDDTFGWGIVFSDQTFSYLEDNDPESHARIIEAGALPDLFAAFDYESAGGIAELIRVGNKQAGLVLAERQRQPVKELIRPKPDVLVLSPIQNRLKELGMSTAHKTISPIGSNQKIRVREFAQISDVGIELHLNAKIPASPLKNL